MFLFSNYSIWQIFHSRYRIIRYFLQESCKLDDLARIFQFTRKYERKNLNTLKWYKNSFFHILAQQLIIFCFFLFSNHARSYQSNWRYKYCQVSIDIARSCQTTINIFFMYICMFSSKTSWWYVIVMYNDYKV